jgi:hypothetical protein
MVTAVVTEAETNVEDVDHLGTDCQREDATPSGTMSV